MLLSSAGISAYRVCVHEDTCSYEEEDTCSSLRPVSPPTVCVCVYYCSTYYKAVRLPQFTNGQGHKKNNYPINHLQTRGSRSNFREFVSLSHTKPLH